MKKLIVVMTVVLSMLVMFVGTVSAAPLASGTATLVSIEYVPGKGPVFTFEVTGKFSNAELKGFLHVEGGEDYDLYCAQVDTTTVTCTVSKKTAGRRVSLSWGGATYWTSVPSAPAASCYDIWDWWSFTNNQWTNFGPHCQTRHARAGDITTYTVPDPSGSYESWVEFYDVDVSSYCPQPVPYNGPAYYFPVCPSFAPPP